MVSQIITLDGINDGTGGLVDFEIFTLPSSFQGLTSVTFTGLGGTNADIYGLDNIVVELASIPEPSTLALFATGLALLGFIGWRRRRAVQVRAA